MTDTDTEHGFGRRPEFDERSRGFPIRALLDETKPLRSYTWRCNVALDQGPDGACVGFAWAHELAARPAEVDDLDYDDAFGFYRAAQQVDEWPGDRYEGTSVLAGAKVVRAAGWIAEYRWAFTFRELALGVGYNGPAVIGVDWLEGMMAPDRHGIVRALGRTVGGHAVLVNGIDVNRGLLRIHNSWGPGWGIDGECFMYFDDVAHLLARNGEACFALRRTTDPER